MKSTYFGALGLLFVAGLVFAGPGLGSSGQPPRRPTIEASISQDTSESLAACSHDDPGEARSAAGGVPTPFNYTTGFEPVEGFVARDSTCVQDTVSCTPFTGECGWIQGQGSAPFPGPWAVSSSNIGIGMIEGHVDTVNPHSGTQHLRISKDLCDTTNFASFATDARIPASPPPFLGVIGPATYRAQIAMCKDYNPDGSCAGALFGANVNFQPQANSQGCFITRMMFFYYGFFYILDDPGTGLTFVPVMENWNPLGEYREVIIHNDPCANFICIDNGSGTPLGVGTGAACPNGNSDCRECVGGDNDGTNCVGDFQCTGGGSCEGGDCVGRIDYRYDVDGDGSAEIIYQGTVFCCNINEQLLIYTDNLPGDVDLDDVVVETGDPCPVECGNLELEYDQVNGRFEECDGANDTRCPGRCVPPGETGPGGEAECTCIVDSKTCEEATDLPNGTTNVVSHGGWWTFVADAPAYAVDTCGSTGYDSALIAYGGDCDSLELLSSNDDCDVNSPYSYGNADPLAPCHPVNAPWEACLCIATTIGNQYWVQDTRAGVGGSTNITLSKRFDCGAIWVNGACCSLVDGTCADDVAEADCQGAGQEFTLAKLCAGVTCEGRPGACCDRSPGAGGACADGVPFADCQSPQDVWTVDTQCVDVACDEASGACCNGFTGTCSVTLIGDCSGPNQAWTKGATCNDVTCEPIPGACCQYEEVRPGVIDVSCTDALTQSQCAALGDVQWQKGSTCDEVECGFPIDRIPTVSEWGMLVLALALLIAAKVWYGYRQSAPAS